MAWHLRTLFCCDFHWSTYSLSPDSASTHTPHLAPSRDIAQMRLFRTCDDSAASSAGLLITCPPALEGQPREAGSWCGCPPGSGPEEVPGKQQLPDAFMYLSSPGFILQSCTVLPRVTTNLRLMTK